MPIVGETLAGRYRIDAALGAGATAVVYRARDLRLERDVAVKVLLPNLARDPLVAGRFDREARALAAAAHPGIVSVYDVDAGDPTTGRDPFFVMELCDGGSLAETLDKAGGRLSPETFVPLLTTIAGGLASLHARGVIHRDVKPHNIMLCGGSSKLADFGLARAQDTTRMTAAGTGAGTLAYLAPELLAGHEAGPAADVYALGVVAFQGLTGRLPRPSATMVELVDTRLVPAAPVSTVAPDLGRAFDGPIGAALSPDPAQRPSPMALATALDHSLMRWRAARPSGDSSVPGARASDSTQEIRLPRGSGGRRTSRRDRATSRPSLLGPSVAALALGALAVIVILVVVQAGVANPGPTAAPTPSGTEPSQLPSASPTASVELSPSPLPTESASASPSATAVPVVTPSPSATAPRTPAPTPPPVWSPQAVQGEVNNVLTAISNAEANASFDDPADIDELRTLAAAVQKPLDERNRHDTAVAALALSQKLQEIVAAGRLHNAQELQQAVSSLVTGTGPP